MVFFVNGGYHWLVDSRSKNFQNRQIGNNLEFFYISHVIKENITAQFEKQL